MDSATWYDSQSNFHEGKETEDNSICAAMNHVLARMSMCHC